jgi:hypothetical protein
MANFASLITGRKPKLATTKKIRHCKHCRRELSSGTKCVEIPDPGSSNAKTYCLECCNSIIGQTHIDLKGLELMLKKATSEV